MKFELEANKSMKGFLLVIFFLLTYHLGHTQVTLDNCELPLVAISDSTSTKGMIAVKVCVDRLGFVISAEITETNTTSKKLKELAIKNAKKHRFKAAPLAPEIQCGILTFDFKVK